MLKKLLKFLPVSRRKHAEALNAIAKVIDGLIEAESNHCQIEMSIMQQMQQGKAKTSSPSPSPSKKEKGKYDPAFM